MLNEKLGLWNIIFGSNHFIETNGIIQVKGKELFKIENISFGEGFRPLISVEIRDKDNKLIGKLHKSTSFVYCDSDYARAAKVIASHRREKKLARQKALKEFIDKDYDEGMKKLGLR